MQSRLRATVAALVVVAGTHVAAAPVRAQLGRPIVGFTVENTAPVIRQEIVRASIPFAKGACKDLANLQVRGIDTAWLPLTYWDDGSIQWAQAQFFDILDPSALHHYEIIVGKAVPKDRLTIAAPWLLAPILQGKIRTEVEDVYGTVYDTGLELDYTAGPNGVVVSTPYLITYRLRSYHRPKDPKKPGIGRDFLSLTAYLTFFHFCAHAEFTLVLGNDYRGADNPGESKDPNLYPLGNVRFRRFSLMIRGKELAFVPRYVQENELRPPTEIREDGEFVGWRQDLIGPGKSLYLGDGCTKLFDLVMFAPLGNPRIASTNEEEQRRRESAHALAAAPLIPMVDLTDLRRSGAANAHGGPAPATPRARALADKTYRQWRAREHFGVFGTWGDAASTHQTGTPRNTPIALHEAYRTKDRGLMVMGIAQSLQQSVRPYHLFGLQVEPEQDIYLEGMPMRRGEQWVSRETLGRSHLPEITELHRRELLLPYRGPYGFNAFDYEHFTVDLLYECYCMTGMAWMKDELALLGEQLKGMLRPAKYYFSTPRHTRGEGWCMKGLALIHRATRNESLRQLALERIPILEEAQRESGAAVAQFGDARAVGEGVPYDSPWQQAAYVMGMIAAYREFGDQRFAELALTVSRILCTDGWEEGVGPKHAYAIGNPTNFKSGTGIGCQEFASPALVLAAEVASELGRDADRTLFLRRANELWQMHRGAGIERLSANKWWQIHLDRFPNGRIYD
ncbi:MAG: hypothetical protein KDC95_05930 [Planctomycetes bacterium]|nr:hypothetical protein [Planctomycetota bacterium]